MINSKMDWIAGILFIWLCLGVALLVGWMEHDIEHMQMQGVKPSPSRPLPMAVDPDSMDDDNPTVREI